MKGRVRNDRLAGKHKNGFVISDMIHILAQYTPDHVECNLFFTGQRFLKKLHDCTYFVKTAMKNPSSGVGLVWLSFIMDVFLAVNIRRVN